jgi:exonuclease III
MQLKVMQYNICGGFYSNEPYTHQTERQAEAVEIVRKENPDILLICEARFCAENKYGILQNYREIFGYDYGYTAPYKERSGIAILSKIPFTFENNASGMTPWLRGIFKIDGKEITIDLVHPHPTISENERENFIMRVMNGMKEKYILAGDFNAVSPKDKYNRDKMFEGFSRFDENAKTTVEKFLTSKTISAVLSHGLIDTFLERGKNWHYTVPTDFLNKHKESGLRIDFIFCSKDVKIINSGIIANDSTNKASDHYPIYAVLEF